MGDDSPAPALLFRSVAKRNDGLAGIRTKLKSGTSPLVVDAAVVVDAVVVVGALVAVVLGAVVVTVEEAISVVSVGVEVGDITRSVVDSGFDVLVAPVAIGGIVLGDNVCVVVVTQPVSRSTPPNAA